LGAPLLSRNTNNIEQNKWCISCSYIGKGYLAHSLIDNIDVSKPKFSFLLAKEIAVNQFLKTPTEHN